MRESVHNTGQIMESQFLCRGPNGVAILLLNDIDAPQNASHLFLVPYTYIYVYIYFYISGGKSSHEMKFNIKIKEGI